MAEQDLAEYRRHQEQQAERQAAAREQLGHARTHGNQAGGTR